jgi:Zn-dependent protease with chaperone function
MNFPKQLLIGLTADEFRHPFDLEATQSLRQLPGFDLLIRNLLSPVTEQFYYIDNIASSILVSEKQLPHLHQLLVDACQILDIEPPQLYIKQNPSPNAYTLAMRGKRPFIVIHTSLIDILTPEEIQAVIAHELGHLKCEHGVLITMANILVLATGLLPIWGNMVAESLRARMLQWVRCAEFSCDRAALLATQNPPAVMSVLMKLTGGSPTLASQLNLDAFIEQARAYDEISLNELGKSLKSMQNDRLTHPVPVLRAREIDRWASSQEYQLLLDRRKIGYSDKASIKGEWRNW